MKKIIVSILVLVLILSVAGCGEPKQSSAPEESPQVTSPEEETSAPEESSDIEFNISENPIYVADASQYRGSVVEINKQDDGTYHAVLEEYEGTSYGAKQITILIDANTALTADPSTIVVGDYIEVFYGGPIEAGIEEVLPIIGLNNLGPANSRNYNGVIKEIILGEEDGTGSILMVDFNGDNETVFNYDKNSGTQFYLDFEKLEIGTKLNVFHDIAVALSMPPQIFALEVRFYDEGSDEITDDVPSDEVPEEEAPAVQ